MKISPPDRLKSSPMPGLARNHHFSGNFHIEPSAYKALGKYFNSSSGPYLFTERKVLAPGSLCGFMEGKNYSRCKRVHSLLAAAFQFLIHIEEFLKVNAKISQEEINIRFLFSSKPI
jgi:hypothetical protein